MKNKRLDFTTAMKMIGIVFTAGLIVLGCKQFNDDPAERSDTITVDVQKIQNQLGYTKADAVKSQNSGSSNISPPTDTDASNAVRSILIGAMVVTSRSTPYTSTTALTEAEVENMEDDLLNSVNYFKMINLPTTSTYLTFDVPPETAGNWQVVAVGLDFDISVFDDLSKEEHDGAVIYAGFVERFFTRNDVGDGVLGDDLLMKRACLNSETVKGCATYNVDINDDPVVTAAVEIVGVQYTTSSGTEDASGDFPILVRSSSGTGVLSPSEAIEELIGIRDAITVDPAEIISLTVLTTHMKNTSLESSACTSLLDANIDTTSDLTSVCDTQEYTVPIVN